MADYAKKTVVELNELLKARGLPTTGKKADLVARLNEADKEAEPSPAPEDVASTEEAAEPTQPSLANPLTATKEVVKATTETAPPPPSQPLAQDARESSAATTGTDTKLAAAVSYSMNLPTSTVDEELKKRKARAERFGNTATAEPAETATATATKEDETQRALERAKRFGTAPTTMSKLDQALPEERERRKRPRGDEADVSASPMDDPGLKEGRGGKRNFRGGGRGGGGGGGAGRGSERGRGGRVGGGAEKPQGVVKVSAAFTNDKDRMAAEARKKKFGLA